MASKATFTAQQMFAELRLGPDYVLTGMVKEQEEDKSIILFAPVGDCNRWTPVEEKLVKSYEVNGTVACGDHKHHVVTLHLLRPALPEAQVFAQATLHAPTFSPFNTSGLATRRLGAGTDCVWDSVYKVWRDPRTWEICPIR